MSSAESGNRYHFEVQAEGGWQEVQREPSRGFPAVGRGASNKLCFIKVGAGSGNG